MPLEFMRGGRTYFKNTGLRLAVESIMLTEEAKPTGVSAQNRLSMPDQRGFTATIALSKSF